ncbi:hypothetical protein PIGHUM_00623 [Pigmentiphaga humi]|uniref:Uncharacterized protein n=1 Tax=Pigmentiphaga humi TaxID=2478468 RepID=A0A3P4AYX3_9BURK|nr:hypothetical protein [Pigmentiphaga humi]VCU68566.1 hypothetical protein PIGHUM_00623 [Pigmentiphaga humi]
MARNDDSTVLHDAGLIDLDTTPQTSGRRIGQAQNFSVEWIDSTQPHTASSAHELLLLLPGAGAHIEYEGGRADAPGRSLCIIPAGTCTIALDAPGPGILIASSRTDLAQQDYLNAVEHDPRIVASTPAFRRVRNAGALRVIAIDDIIPPPDKKRLKMLQTDTLSINWVEYDGPRDRTQLSPHSHARFEQGSLAIEGKFVHHLRTPWGSDATRWRDDVHLQADPRTLLVIPVNLVHTTEGVGPGYHLLIDVFSPPRRDFIANNWVCNSADYDDPAAGA